MLQPDVDSSNGDTTNGSFEIIDKKNAKTESISSSSSNNVSSSGTYSIPSPSLVNMSSGGGNLLSNVQPPSSLPDFTLWHSPSAVPTIELNPEPQFPQRTQFSAAVPPSKGMPIPPPHQQQDTATTPVIPVAGGLIGWMREAVSTGGILSKVAERAKSSVDSIITTLDPQMSEFIYSGGDLEIVVASKDIEEIVPIREAIYSVLGKAWVNELDCHQSVVSDDETAVSSSRAIGLADGVKRAELKLEEAAAAQQQTSRKGTTPPAAVIIVVENILLQQQDDDDWYDLSVLVLKDTERQIIVKTFTQTTPIPIDLVLKNSPDKSTTVSREKLICEYLASVSKIDWQQTIAGVSRREIIYMAAKVLINIYKSKINNNK